MSQKKINTTYNLKKKMRLFERLINILERILQYWGGCDQIGVLMLARCIR